MRLTILPMLISSIVLFTPFVIAGLRFGNQSYRASGLKLITAAITLWNTVYIENAINHLKKKGLPLNDQLLSHLPPLDWEHINYIGRTNKKLAKGKYRPLRPVDVSQYKKQP